MIVLTSFIFYFYVYLVHLCIHWDCYCYTNRAGTDHPGKETSVSTGCHFLTGERFWWIELYQGNDLHPLWNVCKRHRWITPSSTVMYFDVPIRLTGHSFTWDRFHLPMSGTMLISFLGTMKGVVTSSGSFSEMAPTKDEVTWKCAVI